MRDFWDGAVDFIGGFLLDIAGNAFRYLGMCTAAWWFFDLLWFCIRFV